MTRLSSRIQTLTSNGNGWAVYYRAREMKAAGVDVFDLTIGEHDRRTDPVILAAMDASARGGNTGYAHLTGSPALRDAIAARVEAQSGVTTTRENVAVVPGGQYALFAALMAGMDAGGEVLFPDPYYASYPGTVRAAGGQPVPVAARPEDGFQPRASDLLAACSAATRAILINSPNNPTGAVYTPEVLGGIARVAQERDLWVLSDEVYDTQCWTGPHRSPRALPDMAERTLVAGSMSKSHAMTGSRIGWLIGPPDLIAGVGALANTTTYGPPGYIQDATIHALSLGDAFEARIAAPFRRRRDLCLARLAEQQSVGVIASGGAMYLMLDVRATGLSGEDFALQLLEMKQVAVMPGESFGAAAAGHVRLALTLPDAELRDALDILLTFSQELSQ